MKYHQDEMIAQGFTIDNHCNPPVAYKGPRFDPTEMRYCYTDLETELLRAKSHIASSRLNKADVLFMYDHADEQTRRVMIESLLDRMETLEKEDVPNAEVKTFLDRIGWKTPVDPYGHTVRIPPAALCNHELHQVFDIGTEPLYFTTDQSGIETIFANVGRVFQLETFRQHHGLLYVKFTPGNGYVKTLAVEAPHTEGP